MEPEKTVKVRYVGKKPMKKDVVCKTLTVWFGENDVQEVPVSVAQKLCQFPAVWQMADQKPLDRPAAKPKEAPQEPEASTEDDAEGENQEETEGEEAPEEESEAPENTESVTAEEIEAILSGLDRETEFTAQNKPRVDAIRARFPGRDVDSTAMKAAWTSFTAAE